MPTSFSAGKKWKMEKMNKTGFDFVLRFFLSSDDDSTLFSLLISCTGRWLRWVRRDRGLLRRWGSGSFRRTGEAVGPCRARRRRRRCRWRTQLQGRTDRQPNRHRDEQIPWKTKKKEIETSEQQLEFQEVKVIMVSVNFLY